MDCRPARERHGLSLGAFSCVAGKSAQGSGGLGALVPPVGGVAEGVTNPLCRRSHAAKPRRPRPMFHGKHVLE